MTGALAEEFFPGFFARGAAVFLPLAVLFLLPARARRGAALLVLASRDAFALSVSFSAFFGFFGTVTLLN